jgi:hypothetical protein
MTTSGPTLVSSRLDATYGLWWGGTTVDWDDVQAGAADATALGLRLGLAAKALLDWAESRRRG